MQFRKKPVVIDAIQFLGNYPSKRAIEIFMGKELDANENGTGEPKELHIPTLEGTMIALENDWIIRGVKGEFYPCKPDIFAMTYERPDDAQPLLNEDEKSIIVSGLLILPFTKLMADPEKYTPAMVEEDGEKIKALTAKVMAL